MNFKDFLSNKLLHIPYDLNHNPFGFKYTIGSDISAHMPFLTFLALQCNHITEFGTRECYSTVAFLQGCKENVVSYDIIETNDIIVLKNITTPCKWSFILHNTIDPNLTIDQTDLLFIDTLHTYDQVKQELLLHSNKVNKYIVFHDTFSFPEINIAIDEFLQENNQWKLVYNVIFNHGLKVLQKC